jgi:ADP-ribosylglycohydrolase
VTPVDRAAGALVGLALGDALGAPMKFCSFDEIVRRWRVDGPPEPIGTPARVTDDMQMALALGEALLEHDETGSPLTVATLEAQLRRAFVAWATSPNRRALGMTCLRTCDGLRLGLPWLQATVRDSKGCGANMRGAARAA